MEILRLVAVTDDRLLPGRDLVASCLAATRGGATAVQLRLKHAPARELATMARALLQALEVPVFINDAADVAIAVGAAGVHLGPGDVPAGLVRRVAPPGFLIGVSVGLVQEMSNGAEADYWGVGPLRATRTKGDAGEPLGLAGFSAIASRSGQRPCVAIGGVMPDDVDLVRGAGGAGVAVVSGIFGAGDPEANARRYRDK